MLGVVLFGGRGGAHDERGKRGDGIPVQTPFLLFDKLPHLHSLIPDDFHEMYLWIKKILRLL
jgi:hypothetical protein